jgi:hypothetical protein
MNDAIQRNAANMLAVSLQFATCLAAGKTMKPATPLSTPIKEALPFMRSNCRTTNMLAPT